MFQRIKSFVKANILKILGALVVIPAATVVLGGVAAMMFFAPKKQYVLITAGVNVQGILVENQRLVVEDPKVNDNGSVCFTSAKSGVKSCVKSSEFILIDMSSLPKQQPQE